MPALTSQYKPIIRHRRILFWLCVLALAILNPWLIHADPTDVRIISLILALYFANISKISHWFIVIILYLMSAYAIVGMTHGTLNVSFIASVMDTNTTETLSFLPTIPLQNWFVALLGIALTYAYHKLSQPLAISNQKIAHWLQHKRKVTISVCVFLCILGIFTAYTQRFIKSITNIPYHYYEYNQALKLASTQPDHWQIKATLPNYQAYDNYVVVVGESVRQDYLSVYGYPHQTTPFLNHHTGQFFSNMYSMGGNTVTSLERTLALTKDAGNTPLPTENVMTLANKADYQTYWISNQGKLSKFDASTSAVALRADTPLFLKKGKYDDVNYDDEMMLDILQQQLDTESSNNNKKSSRVFFLHMYGSHPDICERLHGFERHFSLNMGEQMDCYLASIEKTDQFIAHLLQILQQHGSYSMIYFSDHGLFIDKENIHHTSNIQNTYHVPFFKISSDDTKQQFIKQPISQRHFLDFFANWLGVVTDKTDRRYDFQNPQEIPADKDITVFNGEKMVPLSSLETQPILQ
ncbi:phosphoethanolamine transferase [Psychrobacter sp. I-STPA6b]|uniref:phosphoethanolamine transferase n=1 Tax=Psychrobacter sp. I-STPA6b TaxID=2585718 RepID=UPI001D0CB0C9|nr:phosphoethanolamine transferase [Psychrobacter sp. I-STPA6b]